MPNERTMADGTAVTGVTARVMLMLDGRDPVGNDLPMDDGETLAELREVWPEMWWCPELRCTVIPTEHDTYEAVQGTGTVLSRLQTLNAARWEWMRDTRTRAEAMGATDYLKALDRYRTYLNASGNASRMNAVCRLFQDTVTIGQGELDTEPTVLGTPVGVLDLDTRSLCVDDGNDARRFKVTQRTSASYDSYELGVDHDYDPRWDEFVDEVMCGDAEKADFLQRAAGYSIMGGNPEAVMFVLYGATTRNGKSTFTDAVKHALGTYATTASRTFLTRSNREEGGTDEALAALVGKRVVTISEPPKGTPLDEGRVKDITACGEQTTSRKFGAQFTFTPQFTLWMTCNNLPVVGDPSVFKGDRIVVITFDRHFERSERDTGLLERLTSPRGSYTVLRWLVEGYRKYMERGLAMPDSVREATEMYAKSGGSPVDRFIDAYCRISPTGSVRASTFNGALNAYCENVLGTEAMTAKRIYAELRAYGVSTYRSHGTTMLRGISMLSEEDIPEVAEGAREGGNAGSADAPATAPASGRVRLR